MFRRRLSHLYSEYGITLLAKKNAMMDIKAIKIITLPIARWSEIPDDFIAANSVLSAKFPKTINEVTRMVKGRTNGIRRGETYHKNFRTIHVSKSLPANSDMYSQMVCKTKMNIKIMKTLANVFK